MRSADPRNAFRWKTSGATSGEFRISSMRSSAMAWSPARELLLEHTVGPLRGAVDENGAGVRWLPADLREAADALWRRAFGRSTHGSRRPGTRIGADDTELNPRRRWPLRVR